MSYWKLKIVMESPLIHGNALKPALRATDILDTLQGPNCLQQTLVKNLVALLLHLLLIFYGGIIRFSTIVNVQICLHPTTAVGKHGGPF